MTQGQKRKHRAEWGALQSVTKWTGNTIPSTSFRRAMSNSTTRRFCFTLNNYTERELTVITTFINDYAKYGIVGKELAPTTNTPHLQGFINLQKPMRFNTIKKHLTDRVHIEKTMGTDEQNQTYCRKAGDYFEKGTPSHQGLRSDLQRVVETINAGETNITTLAKKHPIEFIKYHAGMTKLLKLTNPIQPRYYKTDVYYYWGPPGTGKSRRALEEATATDKDSIYYKPRGLWWDGYQQQTCIIIDDFYGWIKYDEMLKIMDRYPYKVQVKGGFEEFTSKKIWITSNIDTDLLYKFTGYNDEAFCRRITNKIHII